MDDAGNILVRRYSKSNVYVKSTAISPNEETAIGSEVLKSPNQSLEHDKVMKVSEILIVFVRLWLDFESFPGFECFLGF